MKIIHTADWHLGKILNGQSFLEDQRYILDQFKEKMHEEDPDLIVIAGDLYDTSYPNKDTVQLLESTIAELNLKMKIPMIVISGNHDGRTRLKYGANWFEHSKLYIRTSLEDMDKPIEFDDVCFYTLPYATIGEIQYFFKGEKIKTYEEAIERCLKHMTKHLDSSKVNILIAHMTVAGGIHSDSERSLTIGTVEDVPEKYMKHFDSVMLGHLHHPFSIQSEFVYYSGSLLQYSFSECGQAKGYRRVMVDDTKQIKSTFVPLVPLHELEVINATYEDVIQEHVEVKNKDNYFHFNLTNMSHVNDPILKLKQIYQNVLALTNQSQEQVHQFSQKEIKKMSDESIIQSFYEDITSESLSEIQLKKINHILNHAIKGDES